MDLDSIRTVGYIKFMRLLTRYVVYGTDNQ